MNQKDYKEIAKIIKDSRDNCRCKLCYVSNKRFEILASSLADYFEREDKKLVYPMPNGHRFNRATFLKECGVEK